MPSKRLKSLIEKTSQERLKICRECPFNSVNATKAGTYHSDIRTDEHCIRCGCPLSSKTRCLSCKCPLDPPKWDMVINDAEENDLLKILSNENPEPANTGNN